MLSDYDCDSVIILKASGLIEIFDMFPHTKAYSGYVPSKRISNKKIQGNNIWQLSIPLQTRWVRGIDVKEEVGKGYKRLDI